ncbi:MAG: winged helix-turn-helix domain-containing protein [Rikenellaceae bacterium]|nr:winged helix-turn-helix domain-containing protein [Rikenellaceae bacterium]
MHQILDLIKKNPRISRAELSEKTGLHGSSMTRRRIPSMRFQRPPASAVLHNINM